MARDSIATTNARVLTWFSRCTLGPAHAGTPRPTALRFEVTIAPDLAGGQARAGRLLVVLGPPDGGEPRLSVGRTGMDAPPILGRDVTDLAPGRPAILDDRCAIFPIARLGELRPGVYAVQALLHTNPDLNFPNAPGDLYSEVRKVRIDPAAGGTVALELSRALPEETLPADTELVKYIKIRSELLERLPRPADLPPRRGDPAARLRPRARPALSPAGPHRRLRRAVHRGRGQDERRDLHSDDIWMADDTPRMILLQLDGAGPLGDPYQVNSANHGPYGDAVTRELIPHVERTFRGHRRGDRPGCSTAARPAAGSRWRSRSSIPTSSTAPGRSAPTASISGRSSSSISTKTRTPM